MKLERTYLFPMEIYPFYFYYLKSLYQTKKSDSLYFPAIPLVIIFNNS